MRRQHGTIEQHRALAGPNAAAPESYTTPREAPGGPRLARAVGIAQGVANSPHHRAAVTERPGAGGGKRR